MSTESDASLKEAIYNYQRNVIQLAFRDLLTDKHLYQTVNLSLENNTSAKKKWAELLTSLKNDFECKSSAYGIDVNNWPNVYSHFLNDTWHLLAEHPARKESGIQGLPSLHVKLKTVELTCGTCKSKKAFNSIEARESDWSNKDPLEQTWMLVYQCQICRSEHVRFLIHRKGFKLQICGRFPVESTAIPKFIPEEQSEYFGKAIIAANTGYVLAGIFLLRVFIEQFWRSIPSIKAMPSRATGDEMGDAYQATLKDFPVSTFPSLKDVYGTLSEAMHSADENLELFNKCQQKIEAHFSTIAQLKANADLLKPPSS